MTSRSSTPTVAWAETFAAELTVTRAADVAACAAGFAAFEQVAVYGDAGAGRHGAGSR